ncbi:RNA ligase 1 and tail fiber attachment catalyst [Escherichia phage KIT01]|nr:RNA ligase 1 and tail fiber attachment catalyst [Escherichia phage KIT01]
MIELYDNLMALVKNSTKSKFFFKDFQSALGVNYRIFSYNYASYSDWLEDGALECRGIMFEMDENGPVRIAARPMQKFFNLDENPLTIGLDLSPENIDLVMAKEDGSLISTFMDRQYLSVKSKGSIHSSMVHDSLRFLRLPENEAFAARLEEITKAGYTCNLEYVAPTNRIVLAYQETNLILLNVRNNETGEYIPYAELFKDGALRKHLVESYDLTEGDFVENIRKQEGVEGFIFVLKDGTFFKLKTAWYSALHHTKDSINNNERLFEVVVAGGTDDLRGLFSTDSFAIEKIDAFERIHLDYLEQSLALLEAAYSQLKGRDRKDYAVTGQLILKDFPGLFSILMQAYVGGINYDTVMDQINSVFLKNHKAQIPEKYLKEIVLE